MNRIQRTVGVFFSGCLVYVFMAACSGGESSNSLFQSGQATGATSTGTGGHGGMGATASGGIGGIGTGGSTMSSMEGNGGDSGIMDALMDPVPNADAMPDSGSRLKGKYLLGDDGSKDYLKTSVIFPNFQQPNTAQTGVVSIWWDSMRAEDCSFRTGADGKPHCLPMDAVGIDGEFLDGGCTIGIAIVIATPFQCNSVAPPKYAEYTDPQTCPTDPNSVHVYPLGQPVAIPLNTPIWNRQAGVCTAHGAYQYGPQWAAYKLGAEVPASSFVGATPMIDP